ncbi:MAG: succinylglutamate desuccinylase/aspartoacylase family protein, partial [Bacteroidales bacterium]|nr:succinylglutamate desuccinylase/aspartoacylase family protein [Bacteroidales bacterium]
MNLQRQIRTSSLKLLFLLLLGHLASTPVDAQWTKSVQFTDSDMALDLTEALTFRKYPTYNQYLEMMQGFASAYPEICRLDTFGTSLEGRLLLALKISDNVDLDEPEAAFLYSSTMHGNEVVGYVLLLRLADTLLSGYGVDSEITTLVDNLQIWINPLANPDGSFSNDNNLSLKNAIRRTVDGIDLNRNFPDPKAGEPDDTTGRALENRHMMEFLREHRFSLSANLHSGEEVVNYPWDHTPVLHADDDWYRFISRE